MTRLQLDTMHLETAPTEETGLAQLDLTTLKQALEYGIVSGNEAVNALIRELEPSPEEIITPAERRARLLAY
jgi:hypothetical protein